MADLIAHTLSNTFRVTNEVAFLEWCQRRHLRVHITTHPALLVDVGVAEEPVTVFSIQSREGETWPFYDHEDEDEYEIEIEKELAAFLHPEDVAILLEIANEGDRYVGGVATAVHSDGRSITLTLQSIYQLAKEQFGPNLNIAEALY